MTACYAVARLNIDLSIVVACHVELLKDLSLGSMRERQ
jgi:hypothetical protein